MCPCSSADQTPTGIIHGCHSKAIDLTHATNEIPSHPRPGMPVVCHFVLLHDLPLADFTRPCSARTGRWSRHRWSTSGHPRTLASFAQRPLPLPSMEFRLHPAERVDGRSFSSTGLDHLRSSTWISARWVALGSVHVTLDTSGGSEPQVRHPQWGRRGELDRREGSNVVGCPQPNHPFIDRRGARVSERCPPRVTFVLIRTVLPIPPRTICSSLLVPLRGMSGGGSGCSPTLPQRGGNAAFRHSAPLKRSMASGIASAGRLPNFVRAWQKSACLRRGKVVAAARTNRAMAVDAGTYKQELLGARGASIDVASRCQRDEREAMRVWERKGLTACAAIDRDAQGRDQVQELQSDSRALGMA